MAINELWKPLLLKYLMRMYFNYYSLIWCTDTKELFLSLHQIFGLKSYLGEARSLSIA